MLMLSLLPQLAAAYSINRAGAQQNAPTPAGLACIPVPVERLVAPGQRATMHIYDTSSLQVLRHAQAHSNSTYGQVVIDEAAMRERRFALEDLGTRAAPTF